MKKILLLLPFITLLTTCIIACNTVEKSKIDMSDTVSQTVSQTKDESVPSENQSGEAGENLTEISSTPEESKVHEESVPAENSTPDVSGPVAENTKPEKDDGWDFLKGLQVFGGCMSDSSDIAVHPFVDGFLEATTRYYEYEENLDLLYPVKIIVYRYTNNDSAYDLPRITKLLNESEFKQFEGWLGATDVEYSAKAQCIYVYPEDKNAEAYIEEYTVIHTELSADDMNQLVELGKANGYHLNIVFCADDECLEGKHVYYPDGCIWHDCYEDFGAEIPDDCFNKK